MITNLIRSVHGRSVWATYKFQGFKMQVYLRHTIPCSKYYGNLNIACYIKPNDGNKDISRSRHEFDTYIGFKSFRNSLNQSTCA